MRLLLDVSAVPAQPVGAGVYTVELARALGGLREPTLELHLLARRDDGARWRSLAPEAQVVPAVPAARPARLVWEQIAAPRLAERLGVHIWHGPHYTLPLRLACPSAVTVHDLTFFEHPEWHERAKVAFFRPMIRAAVARAAVIVAVSGRTARRLEEVLAPETQVITVAHGVDQSRFCPDGARGAPGDLALLARLGVHPPYVAFVGTMEPRKAVPTLVAAFARVAAGRPDLRLVLAGRDGWGSEAVRAAVAASGVATRIARVRWVPEEALPALYRQAAAVAYPSLEEGFGLPALEALACGAPLVTSSGSAMAEVSGEAALLVPPGDAAALAEALIRLLDDPGLARRLREAGPEVAARHTWEASARRHLWAYKLAADAPNIRVIGARSE